MIRIENAELSIWENNPHLELVTGFKKFKETLGDDKSSQVLTAIYYIHDPKSPMRNAGMTDEEIHEDVTANFITIEGFDWDDYEDIIDLYNEKCLSKTEIMFRRFEKDLDDLGAVMEGFKYTKDNARQRAELAKQYKDLMAQYMELKKQVEADKHNAELFANYSESLIEKLGRG